MALTLDHAATVLETAIVSERPIEALLDMAAGYIATGEPKKLHEIDIVLNGRFVELIRNGDKDEVEAALYAFLALLDSKKGDTLKRDPASAKYYHRWEHLNDLCGYALDNYDPNFPSRFLKSRKHGPRLMRILNENPDGVRAKNLADKLGVSPQNLAKLLREFEKEDLIKRRRTKGATIVRLGFLGMAYMAETETFVEESVEPSFETKFKLRIGGFEDGAILSPKNLFMGDLGHHAR